MYAPTGRADLSEDSRLLLKLLDDTHAWRERLVEELVFGAASHVRATSSYQVDIPPDLIGEYVDLTTTRAANVLLPLTTKPKQPLLAFELVGAGGQPAHLVTRKNTAALQARYLTTLVETSAAPAGALAGLSEALLEAICVFTPDLFRLYRSGLRWYRSDRFERALRSYLTDGLPGHVAVTLDDVFRWRDLTTAAGEVLARRLEEPPEELSSSEEVLLALPRMDPAPASVAGIDALVAAYADAVRAADDAEDADLLTAVAEYGRRYEMIVETEVPLLEPSTIKYREDRRLHARRFGWSTHRFALGDARSAHLELRSSDPYVCLGRRPRAHRLDGREIGVGPLESVRQTEETLSLYSSETERPYYVDVGVRLIPRLHLRLSAWVIALLTVAAIAVELWRGGERDLYARLALVIVPTTIAATVALAREQTALASRLQSTARIALLLSIIALWIVALVQIVVFHPPAP